MVEDVDLIAEERGMHHGQHPLKELLPRGALLAATRTPDAAALAVSSGDLGQALDELLAPQRDDQDAAGQHRRARMRARRRQAARAAMTA